MARFWRLVFVLAVAGCASMEKAVDYRPKSSREKQAVFRADREVSPDDVRADFHAHERTEIAWAGVIRDIQFKETERTIQVAFDIEHRGFDWKDHGGSVPYRLSPEGQGRFVAGWTVDKPARIDYLRSLAKPGCMILVYGKPYRMADGVIQIAATSVRPIKSSDFQTVEALGAETVIGQNL